MEAAIVNIEEGSQNSESQNPSVPMPYNIELEQAVLGNILANNDILSDIATILKPEHFFDPVHRNLYALFCERINRNSFTSPEALHPYVGSIPGLSELQGSEYLYKLADAAVSIHASKDYALEIYNLYLRRSLIEFGNNTTYQAKTLNVHEPVSELIEETEKKLYNLITGGELSTGFKQFPVCLNELIETASKAITSPTKMSGLSTGFHLLDNKLGGLHPSDLIIIAGRPSMGKTAFATNVAVNVAKNYHKYKNTSQIGGHVGFFSLEMSAYQLAARITSEKSGITATQLHKGSISQNDFNQLANVVREFYSLPIHIDDAGSLNIAQLATRARRLKQASGLDLMVVDYLQLLNPVSKRASVNHEVSEISRGLKAIAKELNIPVIAVSQLSRAPEQRITQSPNKKYAKKPQLSDLRDSGSIEQDADIVLFVYREEYYLKNQKPQEDDHIAMAKWKEEMEKVTGKAEIIISKHRQGSTGDIELSFNGKYTLFGNLAESGYEDPGAHSNDFNN